MLVRASYGVLCVCVCGVGARGEGADTQDPLEAVQGRERASMRMCAASDKVEKFELSAEGTQI